MVNFRELEKSKFVFRQIIKRRLDVRREELRLQAIARREKAERAERARLLALGLITAEENIQTDITSTSSVETRMM